MAYYRCHPCVDYCHNEQDAITPLGVFVRVD